MKKVTALVLALLLVLSMATAAFAADVETCESQSAYVDCEIELPDGYTVHLTPGETYLLSDLEANGLIEPDDDETNTNAAVPVEGATFEEDGEAKDFKVSASWTTGGALVKSVGWDKDEKAWVLVLNENYTISTPKYLRGTISFVGKGDNNTDDDAWDFDLSLDTVVCNHLEMVEGCEDLEDALDDPIEAYNNTLYQCEEDESGYIAFNDSALLSCVLNMKEDEKAFMYNDEAMIDKLEEKFSNLDADIECYNFGGSPTFKNAAMFTLQADYANQYHLYEYNGGKLTAVDYDWNSTEGVYEWKTKSPVSYVISDVELVAAAAGSANGGEGSSSTTENPDTGANDVVGLASALAVVSLVAAGAVSLKKHK